MHTQDIKRTTTMNWNLPSPKWIFIFNALLILLRVSVAKTLAPILWDKNGLRGYGPTGFRLEAEINDVVDIICPKTNESFQEYAQYHTFTQVTYPAYVQCDISLGRKKTLLYCNKPLRTNQLRLLFQDQTAFPGEPIFQHGQDYYFITTADGTLDGIDQENGGLCASHNMKLHVHIQAKPTDDTPPPRPTIRRPPPTERHPHRTSRVTTAPKTSSIWSTSSTKPTKRRKITDRGENSASKPGSNKDPLVGDADGSALHVMPSTILILVCSTIAFIRWWQQS